MGDVGDKVTSYPFQATQFGQILNGDEEIVIALACAGTVPFPALRGVRSVFERGDTDSPGRTLTVSVVFTAAWAVCLYTLLHKLNNRRVTYNLVQPDRLQRRCCRKQLGGTLVVVANGQLTVDNENRP